mgnify:CR=1 FL=1
MSQAKQSFISWRELKTLLVAILEHFYPQTPSLSFDDSESLNWGLLWRRLKQRIFLHLFIKESHNLKCRLSSSKYSLSDFFWVSSELKKNSQVLFTLLWILELLLPQLANVKVLRKTPIQKLLWFRTQNSSDKETLKASTWGLRNFSNA